MKHPVTHVPMQRFFGADVNLDPRQILKVRDQRSVVHQASARLPLNQQIQGAVFVPFAAGYGTEYAKRACAVPLGQSRLAKPVPLGQTRAVWPNPPGKTKDSLAPLTTQRSHRQHYATVATSGRLKLVPQRHYCWNN